MSAEPLIRRLFAEGFGSLLLAAAVIGSGIMADRLSAGNAAVALIANTGATVAAWDGRRPSGTSGYKLSAAAPVRFWHTPCSNCRSTSPRRTSGPEVLNCSRKS